MFPKLLPIGKCFSFILFKISWQLIQLVASLLSGATAVFFMFNGWMNVLKR